MRSLVAALQAPVIMKNQNCQNHKDQLAASHAREVKLHVELEMLRLHEKIDKPVAEPLDALIADRAELLAFLAVRRCEASL